MYSLSVVLVLSFSSSFVIFFLISSSFFIFFLLSFSPLVHSIHQRLNQSVSRARTTTGFEEHDEGNLGRGTYALLTLMSDSATLDAKNALRHQIDDVSGHHSPSPRRLQTPSQKQGPGSAGGTRDCANRGNVRQSRWPASLHVAHRAAAANE